MFKSLIYLLRLSIIPILVLTIGKIIGIYLAGLLLDTKIVTNFENIDTLLNPGVYVEDVQTVMTFANLFMFGLLAIGTSLILIQSLIFHDTHIDTKLLSKLANLNLLKLIGSSYQIYHWGVVWSFYLLLGSGVLFIDYWNGLIALWIPISAGIFAFFSLLVLLKDVYNEIYIAKKI